MDLIPVRTFPATPPEPGLEGSQVLVATEVRHLDGRGVPCPAAPLLAGTLMRLGREVRTGTARLSAQGANPVLRMSVVEASADNQVTTNLAAGAHTTMPQEAVRTAIEAWARVARPRRVLLAAPRSFCAGVERAIDVVRALLDRHAAAGRPVYVRKQIVHNTHVVRELEERGAVFVDELDQVPDRATVVFSAHGVSPAVRAEARRRGLDVVDATCPLVTKVHAEARRYAARGETVVLVGHAGHEEVEGTLGEAPASTVLVENAADVERLRPRDPAKVAYLTQTTLAVDETEEVITALKERFPAAHGPGADDICYATTNRQNALRAVADEADLVLVVGSADSSNSQRLAELARRGGTPAHLIEDATHIRPRWLESAGTIGLTAGASAPPALVDQIITALGGLGPVTVSERTTATEDITFAPPTTVRSR